MKKLYITIVAVIIMACLIPLAPYMAVFNNYHPTPITQHLIYMFGHANILHWAINSWALLVLHNLFRPSRLIIVYILAVLISFIPTTNNPMIGASVITCFFFGFLMPHFWHKDRLSACMVAALILVAFFIPGIAAFPHLLMFLSGIAWFYIERTISGFRTFCNS